MWHVEKTVSVTWEKDEDTELVDDKEIEITQERFEVIWDEMFPYPLLAKN